MAEHLLRIEEVCERLNLRPWAAYRLISDGVLDAVYLGGRTVRVAESALDEFIRSGGRRTRTRTLTAADG